MSKYISIETCMRTKGISLREFAKICGIAPSTMSRVPHEAAGEALAGGALSNQKNSERGFSPVENRKREDMEVIRMACYKCGDGIESGKSFIPVDAPGTPNRRWVCTECADLIQKQQARNALGKEGLEVSRIFDPGFLK